MQLRLFNGVIMSVNTQNKDAVWWTHSILNEQIETYCTSAEKRNISYYDILTFPTIYLRPVLLLRQPFDSDLPLPD